jgi:riboflavin kinase / FMN adenylyltransferase
MKVTRGYSDVAVRPYPVGTIGNFDGHHIGHHTLLRQVVETARRTHGTALAVTFDPHPVKILAPHIDLRFLTDREEKLARFEQAGIDEVILLEFSEAFAALSPQVFAEQVLSRGLGIREIFVGHHFAFGHKRAGKIEDLIALGLQFGFTVHPTPPVTIGGGIVSSTRIRQLILAGKVDQAAQLLGRFYALSGVVSPGAGRGRTLGWPTANLHLPSERVIPPDGIYATMTRIDETRYDAVAYLGTRPTFDGGKRLLEIYLLEGTHELYGQTLTVEFVGHIRDDMQFSGEDALCKQIALDVASAKRMLQQYY